MEQELQRFEARAPTTEDFRAIAELILACDLADYGEPDYLEEELLADWKDIDNDPSVQRRSKGSQPFTTEVRGYRTLQAPFALGKLPVVRGGGLANGMDWQMLRANIRASSRVTVVPRFDTAAEIHRTALFGVGRFDPIAHLSGPNYFGGIVVDEAPATAAV